MAGTGSFTLRVPWNIRRHGSKFSRWRVLHRSTTILTNAASCKMKIVLEGSSHEQATYMRIVRTGNIYNGRHWY